MIEVTQFRAPRMQLGSMPPLAPLPAEQHHSFAAGAAAVAFGPQTAIVAILPDVDIRIGVGNDAAGAAAAAGLAGGSMLLKAGALREFQVTPGQWLATVAG
jgi:hypothetical protein